MKHAAFLFICFLTLAFSSSVSGQITLTGTLGTAPANGTTGTFATRLFRGGVTGTCAANTFPGNSGTGPYIYNTNRFTNTTASPVCVTVTLTETVAGTATSNIQVAAFLAPFVGTDITNSARFLGDPGLSNGSPQTSQTFQFTIPANTAVDLVVFSTNASPAGTGTQYTLTINAPTAAGATVSGRVLGAKGRGGAARAVVSMTDQSGVVRTAKTDSLGYYRFEEVAAGQSYVFNVTSSRYQYESQVITINENLEGLNFTPMQ